MYKYCKYISFCLFLLMCIGTRGMAQESSKTLIVFFDGLRPDYITKENMPNLYALKKKGSYGEHHHSVFPTVTRVNSASYATGSYPVTHGLMGNTVYFPQVDKSKGLNTGDAGELTRIAEATSGNLLTTTSLGEILQSAGHRLMVFSSGSTGQAFLQNHKVSGGAIINPDLILPSSIVPAVEKELGAPPAYARPNTARHKWVADAFLKFGLADNGPLVSAIWFSDPDGTAHREGIGSALTMQAIKSVDHELGRVLSAIDSSGQSDVYNILISTDHGFVTDLGKESLPDFLIEKGLKENAESEDVVVAGGAVYVKDHDRVKIRKIVESLQQEEWVGAVFTNPQENDKMKGSVKGTLSFESVNWSHAERKADILVAVNWNDEANEYGYKGKSYAKGVAGHGGSSYYEIHIPFIVAGPAFKKEFESALPTSNIDIVPTILHIHGIEVPAQMNGRVAAELLEGNSVSGTEEVKHEKVETTVKYPWGTYQLVLDRSILGEHAYVNYTKVTRTYNTVKVK